jgi:hypothetical protein
MPTHTETASSSPSDPTAPPAGLEVHRSTNGISVKQPRPTLRQLPYLVKVCVVTGGILLAMFLLTQPREWRICAIMLLSTVACVLLYLVRRTEWRIEDGKLSVQNLPFPGRRSWSISAVEEIKRAPEDTGLLVRITGKDIVEIECPASREVLEYAARVLREALAK